MRSGVDFGQKKWCFRLDSTWNNGMVEKWNEG
jgi:hypothetical protein